uniref:Uncharacterized protein n=1 Tax=Anguilla anguilla TaxID=7936 RepID=A0A0E9UE16_ANGAN
MFLLNQEGKTNSLEPVNKQLFSQHGELVKGIHVDWLAVVSTKELVTIDQK